MGRPVLVIVQLQIIEIHEAAGRLLVHIRLNIRHAAAVIRHSAMTSDSSFFIMGKHSVSIRMHSL